MTRNTVTVPADTVTMTAGTVTKTEGTVTRSQGRNRTGLSQDIGQQQ